MKNSLPKHIIVVGAGPGGLTAAMLLANRGFKVTVFEKEAQVGGRNAAIVSNGYKFDTGPTFLMMKFILDEVFEEAGRHIDDYLKCVKLEPMYRLQFDDVRLEPTTEREAMLRQLDAHFPGNRAGYDKFMAGGETAVSADVSLPAEGLRHASGSISRAIC